MISKELAVSLELATDFVIQALEEVDHKFVAVFCQTLAFAGEHS